jgi:acylphosphatase
MTIAKHVTFSGRVQGVGFRFTAVDAAQRHAVDGTVRNSFDGTVELFVQGESDAVQAFLTDLGRRMGHYIAEQTVQEATPTGVKGFHIVR